MRLGQLARLLAAAGTVLLAAGSTPALGQTADLGVTLTLLGETSGSTAGLTLGGTETYVVTVANAGPTHVTEFTLDALLDGALEVAGVTGCDPVTTDVPFPCTVSGVLLSGGEASVTVDVSYTAPDPLSPGTATCPNGAVDVTSSVTVSKPMQGTATVTDPDAGNDTAAAGSTLRNWADLEVVSVDGPANASEGQTITYTAVVRNNGPCPAPNVRVTLGPSAILTYVDGTVSATCTNGDAAFAEANECELETVAPAASVTVSADYAVGTYPDEMISATIPVDFSIVSRTVTGPSLSLGADDPNGENDGLGTSARVDLSGNEGCSTGGAGTLLGGLLALAASRLGRRRSG